ncbi:hemolysin [Spirochaetia bacterium]|nr:hemolysin [Spirochaetia bacterium]GHV81804.1 hemolysin [Spirochaetia bacterium]
MKSFFKKGEMKKKTYESLESDQQEMIRGVLELPDTTVKEIMVPRIDTIFLAVDTPRDELLNTISESGHSRFPVYEDTIDNVIGVLYVKDVLKALVKSESEQVSSKQASSKQVLSEFDIRSLLRKPFFIPLSKHIDELLRELRRRRVHIAVVVDEYGGVSGIICMEDIIEEIIGDIQDEFDNEQEDMLKLGEDSWLCDARVNLEDLSEEIGVELPAEDFDTLGGFVFDLLGKIPVKYEKAVYEDIDFIIQDMEGHKINTVKVILRRDQTS